MDTMLYRRVILLLNIKISNFVVISQNSPLKRKIENEFINFSVRPNQIKTMYNETLWMWDYFMEPTKAFDMTSILSHLLTRHMETSVEITVKE
jgi:hypothetical protein